MKRILLFVLTNLLVVTVLGVVASLLGVNRYLTANGLNLGGLLAFSAVMAAAADSKLKVLIVDGQNNHKWATTSPILKDILEKSGRFEVAVSTSPDNSPGRACAPN